MFIEGNNHKFSEKTLILFKKYITEFFNFFLFLTNFTTNVKNNR